MTPTRQRTLAVLLMLLAAIAVAIVVTGPAASAAQSPAPPGEVDIRAGRPSAPPGQFGFECFSLTEGKAPNATVILETSNFGRDRVTVRGSRLACESAFRYPASTNLVKAPSPPQILQCFNLDKGMDPNRQVRLTSETVNIAATVRKARMMCENASKTRPPAGPVGLKVNTAWQCFDLADSTPTPGQPATIVTENWGPGTDEVRRARFLCEDAVKERKGFEPYGEATGTAYLCSVFGGTALNGPAILDTANFNEDAVVFGSPALWCEPVQKEVGPATISVPAGRTATLANGHLDACNSLSWGYQINDEALVTVGSKGAGCFEQGFPDATVGPFAQDVTLRIFLTDEFCAVTFFSDGNHAVVKATVPGLSVYMGDAGGSCEFASLPSPGLGNFNVDVLLN